VTLVLFGRLPRVGEKVFCTDYEITVKEVSGMRITKVRVSYGHTKDEQQTAPEEPLDMESVGAALLSGGSATDPEQETLDEYEDALLREPECEQPELPPDNGQDSDRPSGRTVSAAH